LFKKTSIGLAYQLYAFLVLKTIAAVVLVYQL